jgi:hypothetical protein
MTPEHRTFVQNVAPERNEQAPLGPRPTYDDVLDTAVEYSFPASDPIAVETCCRGAAARAQPELTAGPVPPARDVGRQP